MKKNVWYKRFPSDFIAGVSKLSLEELGAYSLCLEMIYDNGGPIDDDAQWLAGQMRCSVRTWKAIRERLIELGKLVVAAGRLTNMRAELEIAKAAKVARKRAEDGAKGGKIRAENAGEALQPAKVSQAPLKPSSSYTRATLEATRITPLPPKPEPSRPLATALPDGRASRPTSPDVASHEAEPVQPSEPIPIRRAFDRVQDALARNRAGRKTA